MADGRPSQAPEGLRESTILEPDTRLMILRLERATGARDDKEAVRWHGD